MRRILIDLLGYWLIILIAEIISWKFYFASRCMKTSHFALWIYFVLRLSSCCQLLELRAYKPFFQLKLLLHNDKVFEIIPMMQSVNLKIAVKYVWLIRLDITQRKNSIGPKAKKHSWPVGVLFGFRWWPNR